MAKINIETGIRTFGTLADIYELLAYAGVKEDLIDLGYSDEQATDIQNGINKLANDLDDLLPGLEMALKEQ